MDLELTILGASSAIPLIHRHPTSQFLTIANRHFLIDCGEGTQVRLRENNVGFSRINHILISHLHGDHFFGLTPLLSSLHLLDRHKEVHIYAPKGLQKVIEVQMKAQGGWLRYPLVFHDLEFNGEYTIFEDDRILVKSFPLNHGIKCFGFLFQEKELPRNIRKAALKHYKIPVVELAKIKTGEDWEDENGKIVPNHDLTIPARKPFSYAYCTDTTPIENLSDYVSEPNLLYHEATFIEKHADRAAVTNHSTAKQAAEMAVQVKAKRLLIGHFSARYTQLGELYTEACEVFENTHLAKERDTHVLKNASGEWIINP